MMPIYFIFFFLHDFPAVQQRFDVSPAYIQSSCEADYSQNYMNSR